jgi:hypothetical protein
MNQLQIRRLLKKLINLRKIQPVILVRKILKFNKIEK